jgi:transcriptional regulator with XRE-family HTH domain
MDKLDQEGIKKEIRMRRAELDMNQSQYARKMGVSPTYLSNALGMRDAIPAVVLADIGYKKVIETYYVKVKK